MQNMIDNSSFFKDLAVSDFPLRQDGTITFADLGGDLAEVETIGGQNKRKGKNFGRLTSTVKINFQKCFLLCPPRRVSTSI